MQEGWKSSVIHYKTIKFNIKIILDIHNSQYNKMLYYKFAPKAHQKFRNFSNFCPPNPKNGSTPLCTNKLCDSPTKYWEESHVSDTHKKLACSQSFIIAFSRVSGRYVKHFTDAKVHKFWLARYHFFSSFLFSSQYNEQDHITSVTNTVMDILYRQTVIYQQCIIEIWEESYVFNADIPKKIGSLALLARNLVYIFSSFQRVVIQ